MSDERKVDPADLERRLADARARERKAVDPAARAESSGWSAGIEFVGAVIVGGFLGWLIDRFTGRPPWAMIIFLILGFAAGVRAVMRQQSKFDGDPSNDRK